MAIERMVRFTNQKEMSLSEEFIARRAAVAESKVRMSRPLFWELRGIKGLMVKIDLTTGAHEFGPEYSPDEAAKAFWQSISGHFGEPQREGH